MDPTANRVLVAEDNFVLSRVIQFNLAQAGFEVTVADNGRQAIELLAVGTFDLVITDYQMPEHDGAAVCDFIRGVQQNTTLPIFLCSAKGLELDAEQLQDRWQLSGVFFKPFSVREMIGRIREVLAAATPATPPPTLATA